MQLFSEWILKDTDDGFMKRAACKGMPFDLFFPERGVNSTVNEAKAICMDCPVREECLRYAMNNNIQFGVWGGMSANQRMKLARKRAKEII